MKELTGLLKFLKVGKKIGIFAKTLMLKSFKKRYCQKLFCILIKRLQATGLNFSCRW